MKYARGSHVHSLYRPDMCRLGHDSLMIEGSTIQCYTVLYIMF